LSPALQLPAVFTSARLVEIALFSILLVAAIVALRLLFTVMTPRHRRRYSKVLNYGFLLGIVLGLVLPWNEPLGVLAATITSLLLLLVAFHYSFLQGRAILRRLGRAFPASWVTVSRESVRDVFLYFSIVTGVIGIITTILSVVIPPFLSLSLGSFVPLSFDTLSVLSAMLEFTFAVPPRGILLSLIRTHLVTTGTTFDTSSLEVDESGFPEIVEGTGYNVRDLAEALDSLAKDGLVLKEGNPGTLRYRLTPNGFRVIQSRWEEAQIRMSSDRRKVEGNLSRLKIILESRAISKPRILQRAKEHLLSAQKHLERMHDEYGPLMDLEWREKIRLTVKEFSMRLAENA